MARAGGAAGERKKDQFFGETETYRKEVRIRVPVEAGAGDPLKLLVTSQGCAVIGYQNAERFLMTLEQAAVD